MFDWRAFWYHFTGKCWNCNLPLNEYSAPVTCSQCQKRKIAKEREDWLFTKS